MFEILSTVKRMPCHRDNRGGHRYLNQIQYLVYHYTANDGDNAVNNAIYYRDRVVRASAHYFVDDENIYQSVDDHLIAWAVGGSKWNDTDQTGGGAFFGIVRNANSISIEMCDTRRDGNVMATEETMARAIELGKALMKKYNIPIERVVRHFDVTGKHCPAYLMDNAAWEAFRSRLSDKKETNDMKLYRYVNELPYGKESVTKAIQNGYIKLNESDGSMGLWEPNLQTVIIMDRAGMLDKPAVNVD